jgi:glycosyltransferase involved in cell wall biosynthesis
LNQGSHQALFLQQKCCVIIPTYNNAKTLATVIDGVLAYTSEVIVVNDGSTDITAEILKNYPNLHIVTHPINKGKGLALRNGFKASVDKGYRYAITIDSDGQHYPDDLPLFLDALAENPDSIIMGARNMGQAGIPKKSSFGHKFSNFWFKFETGIDLADTQSGYRLYPVERLQKLKFYTVKFELEIEVIVRAAWKDIPVIDIPVKVYYPKPEERVSHFRPFKDFSRISVMNAVLVTLALVYYKPRFLLRALKKKV